MNIYVGNLSHQVTEDELKKAFEAFGQVTSVSIIKDKFSGESRGFGFVEMPAKAEAQSAINGLNGKELKYLCQVANTYFHAGYAFTRMSARINPQIFNIWHQYWQ